MRAKSTDFLSKTICEPRIDIIWSLSQYFCFILNLKKRFYIWDLSVRYDLAWYIFLLCWIIFQGLLQLKICYAWKIHRSQQQSTPLVWRFGAEICADILKKSAISHTPAAKVRAKKYLATLSHVIRQNTWRPDHLEPIITHLIPKVGTRLSVMWGRGFYGKALAQSHTNRAITV